MVQGKKKARKGEPEAKAPDEKMGEAQVSEFTGKQVGSAEREAASAQIETESLILGEGREAEKEAGPLDRITYSTWNSIPWAKAPYIALELWAAIFRQGSLGGQKEGLNMKPNYAELNFTPLENSFTRRPNGAGNWVKDIFSGNPYRILSDLEDGVLYSPDGGSLKNIFPGTINSIIGDPLAMGVLKEARVEQLGTLTAEYKKAYSNPAKMGKEELVEAIDDVGFKNKEMFYYQGFRDSMVHKIESEIYHELMTAQMTDEDKAALGGQISGLLPKMEILVPNRGYGRKGIPVVDTSFENMGYSIPKLGEALTGRAKMLFETMPKEKRERLEKLVQLKAELVQEGNRMVEAVEYCRGTLYSLSAELGKKLKAEGRVQDASDVNFLTIYELKDVVDGAADQATVEMRKKAFKKLK
jgi:hypothetical protein